LIGALLLITTGCKSDEERLLDDTLALHEQVYVILKDNVDQPAVAIEALTELEASSRAQRAQRYSELKTVLEGLDEEETKAFQAMATKRYEENIARFSAIVRRYPEERRQRIVEISATITRR
jgi:hypothetical protein